MKQLLISFSGGRTSAFMTWWLKNIWPDRNKWEVIVVFANTGKEKEQSLEFARECDLRFGFNTVWIEAVTNSVHGKGVTAKVVTFETASRNGEPFEAMIRKHGLPNKENSVCTRELKTRAVRAYCRSIGWKRYYTAIGIRADEIDRISASAEKDRYIYPLVSKIPTRKNDINKFWSQQNFDLNLKTYEGNCDLCFKKSLRKLMTIVKEHPETVAWWQNIEEQYNLFIPDSRKHNKKVTLPIHVFRENRNIGDIVELAKSDFEKAKDQSQYIPEYKQGNLFGIELDISNGCTESCEVF